MNITLNTNEYNAVFRLLSAITGKSAVVANKLIEQIRSNADEGRSTEIELIVESYELESILKGIKSLVESDKSTVQDIAFFTFIASTLKIKGAFLKMLEELVDKNASVEIDSSIELDA